MITITKFLAVLFTVVLFAVSCSDQQNVSSGSDLSDSKKAISYSLGVNIGKQFQRDNIDIDIESFTTALTDVVENQPLRLRCSMVLQTASDWWHGPLP